LRSIIIRALVSVLAVSACSPSADRHSDSAAGAPSAAGESAAAGGPLVVTAEAIGPVHFGRPVAAVAAALGESLHPDVQAGGSCGYVRPAALPRGVALMVIQDTVVRVDVDTAGVATAEGARVGDAESRVLALYRGRVAVEPHKYTGPEGHYLVVSPPGDTTHRLIFETDGQRVTRYRAGRRPAVELVEGCS
jgi:hypothetical protein